MKISTIIFTLILIYNSVLSFVLFILDWCSDSKNNKMYSTFTTAYLFNLIINTIILISIRNNSYTPSTLFGGILLASYGWLFAISYGLYKEDNTPDCLKSIAMTNMVFASLFMILIPVAVLLFNESINKSVIKTICGNETGNNCKIKMVEWVRGKVETKIDAVYDKYKNFKTENCKKLINDLNLIKESDENSVAELDKRLDGKIGTSLSYGELIETNKLLVEKEKKSDAKEKLDIELKDLTGKKFRLDEEIKDNKKIKTDLDINNTAIVDLVGEIQKKIEEAKCPDNVFKDAKDLVDNANKILAKKRTRGIIPE